MQLSSPARASTRVSNAVEGASRNSPVLAAKRAIHCTAVSARPTHARASEFHLEQRPCVKVKGAHRPFGGEWAHDRRWFDAWAARNLPAISPEKE